MLWCTDNKWSKTPRQGFGERPLSLWPVLVKWHEKRMAAVTHCCESLKHAFVCLSSFPFLYYFYFVLFSYMPTSCSERHLTPKPTVTFYHSLHWLQRTPNRLMRFNYHSSASLWWQWLMFILSEAPFPDRSQPDTALQTEHYCSTPCRSQFLPENENALKSVSVETQGVSLTMHVHVVPLSFSACF